MRQIQFDVFGHPLEVAQCREVPEPEVLDGEVLVRVLASPINPADLNLIEGTYGVRPDLPAVPGNEACGEVIRSHDANSDLKPGDRVVFLTRGGLWSDQVAVAGADLVKIPPGIDPLQACQLAVNPPTAHLLLQTFRKLAPGDWVAQNAANSAVGRCVIQLARARGLRTVNFARPGALVDFGAEDYFLDEKDSIETARELVGNDGPLLALNAVGGDSALRLMDLLAPEGILVTYGAMSRRSLKVPNQFLIFKRIQLQGLWVTEWMKQAPAEEVRRVLADLAGMMEREELVLPGEAVYQPEAIREALDHAGRSGRSGKIILGFSE